MLLSKRTLCTIVFAFFFIPHIFQKAQVASNKNAHKLQHHFWAQFFMLFHMMWSILFHVLALKTSKWKFLIGYWRTSTNEKVVSWPNTTNKMNHTMWKSKKNCAPKWCSKLCAFLFKVTCAIWKMWPGIHFLPFAAGVNLCRGWQMSPKHQQKCAPNNNYCKMTATSLVLVCP